MKVVHWTLGNGSGLHRVATDLSSSEKKMGIDSVIIPTVGPGLELEWENGVDADIHVIHSHVPDVIRSRTKGKLIFIPHGTPEHCFQGAIEQFSYHGYVAGNSFMLSQYWLQEADVTVTFWKRHQTIWQMLTHQKNVVRHIPLGIDLDFWKKVDSRGKFAGTPSILSLENCHYIKWPLDLIFAWKPIIKELPEARLHLHYLPSDQHRFWYPLLRATGCDYTTYSGSTYYGQEDLRNCFVSSDYYVGLVRYGDFNRTCLEAKACGCKLISYTGNEYADYWISEGDQRKMAEELIAILKNEVTPRSATPLSDISETTQAMLKIYNSI